jgi:endonuclease YncB( thermonuclease family)
VRWIVALIATLALALPATAATFKVCTPRGDSDRRACVYDGDTFWVDFEKIRTMGYDAPEMGWPFCTKAAREARPSRDRLRALLNSGEEIGIQRQSQDDYGRTLAWITIGGESLARIMIREGHGRPWIAGAEHWC